MFLFSSFLALFLVPSFIACMYSLRQYPALLKTGYHSLQAQRHSISSANLNNAPFKRIPPNVPMGSIAALKLPIVIPYRQPPNWSHLEWKNLDDSVENFKKYQHEKDHTISHEFLSYLLFRMHEMRMSLNLLQFFPLYLDIISYAYLHRSFVQVDKETAEFKVSSIPLFRSAFQEETLSALNFYALERSQDLKNEDLERMAGGFDALVYYDKSENAQFRSTEFLRAFYRAAPPKSHFQRVAYFITHLRNSAALKLALDVAHECMNMWSRSNMTDKTSLFLEVLEKEGISVHYSHPSNIFMDIFGGFFKKSTGPIEFVYFLVTAPIDGKPRSIVVPLETEIVDFTGDGKYILKPDLAKLGGLHNIKRRNNDTQK